MTLLVTQSDYNIAYLYYLRGEYSRAIKMLARREMNPKRMETLTSWLFATWIYLKSIWN